MIRNETARKIIFITCAVLCLTPWINPPIALLMGLVIAQLVGHPYLKHNKKFTTLLLQISVVGLGFGMNIQTAMQAGKQGFLFTVASIFGTLILGALLGALLKIDKKTSHLISSGTAICGGSAIAAVAPVIHAEDEQISVALGIVFILNSIALFIFPVIGHKLHLSQTQFGLWSAIAIHDTSSVVGAASSYGAQALQIATTVKLTRALWIIPVALGTAVFFKNPQQKIKIPWFIGYFVIAMCINTYVPMVHTITPYIFTAARAGLTLTLFLIGSGLSKKVLRSVGIRPFIQGVILWIVISTTALWAVMSLAA
jgi:uncharacterized integral membrane protein (TIGR00698 family)